MCRLNKCANISSSSTDDTDNIPETQGDFESPESVSEISDGENVLLDPTNQQFPTDASMMINANYLIHLP